MPQLHPHPEWIYAAFIGLAKKFFLVSHMLLQKTPNELFGQSNKKSTVYIIGKVKVAQSCLTLWDPMDYTVHRILQARILEWVAFPFSMGSSEFFSHLGCSIILSRVHCAIQ